MKRAFCTLLALALLLPLAACGGKTAAPEATSAPAAALAPAATSAPAGTPAAARMSPEEIAEALDSAETAGELKALIDALEGDYADNEPITIGMESITLAEIKELYSLMEALESSIAGQEAGNSGSAAAPDADSPAIGVWKGVYGKFVGDEERNTSESFVLALRNDGTGTHYRDGMEFELTWTLDGESFAMTETFFGSIDYTGTLKDGELHIFNADPSDDWTYEYVYEPGSEDDIAAVQAGTSTGNAGNAGDTGDTGDAGDAGDAGDTGDAGDAGDAGSAGNAGETDGDVLTQLRGDWNGAFGLRACTGEYEGQEEGDAGAIARFAVASDGSIKPFIGINFIDYPITDLSIRYDDNWERFMVSGMWDGAKFEDVPLVIENGTLSVVIPIVKDSGSAYIVINLRRLDDTGWTDEDPRLSQRNIEYCMGKSFGELAELLGFDFLDYPSPDEG